MDSDVVLSNLSIGYATRQGTRIVASAISAAIGAGELTCLLGRNGAGKSTLLRTLSGFLPRLSGRIEVGGRDLADYTDRQLAQRLSVVLTERPDVQQMTAYDLVALGRAPYTDFWGRLRQADRDAVAEAMRLVGIDALAGRQVTTLSDGERQKVMIAKALAQHTSIIFLDEPTAFLDYPSKVETLQLLRHISRQARKTVFLSTHDVELALQLADRLWLLADDGQLSIGTPRQLADSGVLSRFIERPGVTFHPDTLTVTVQPAL